jgi:CHASE3 domain sensor protein
VSGTVGAGASLNRSMNGLAIVLLLIVILAVASYWPTSD